MIDTNTRKTENKEDEPPFKVIFRELEYLNKRDEIVIIELNKVYAC